MIGRTSLAAAPVVFGMACVLACSSDDNNAEQQTAGSGGAAQDAGGGDSSVGGGAGSAGRTGKGGGAGSGGTTGTGGASEAGGNSGTGGNAGVGGAAGTSGPGGGAGAAGAGGAASVGDVCSCTSSPCPCKYSTIQSAIDAASPGATISVGAGTFRENVVVGKSLTIQGAGAGSTIVDGQKSGSVFTVGNTDSSADADVVLSGMTMMAGSSVDYGGGIYNSARLTVTGSTISGNAAKNGGGIYNRWHATLTVTNCSINSNTATASSAAPYSAGGAIYNDGILNLEGGSIDHNYADNGAIYSSGDATMVMTGGSISYNTVRFNGGAIYNDGILDLNGGSLDHNTAMYGGGMFNYGTVNQNGGDIVANTAIETPEEDPRQPGIFGGFGGGVFNDDNTGAYNIHGGTTNNNTAANSGGGIYNSGHLTLENGQINANHATYGGGVMSDTESVCVFTMTGGSISYNVADAGGGIIDYGPLNLSGGSIAYNQATTGYGGGLFVDMGVVAPVKFSGTTITVQHNKSHLPASEGTWKGWGVYFYDSVPTTTDGFDPALQVNSNSQL